MLMWRALRARERPLRATWPGTPRVLPRRRLPPCRRDAGLGDCTAVPLSLRPVRRFLARLRDKRNTAAGLHMTLLHDAHRSLLGPCAARHSAALHRRGHYLERELQCSCLAAVQRTSQHIMATEALLGAKERRAAAGPAGIPRCSVVSSGAARRACAAMCEHDEVRASNTALRPV
jgi:hypothetical protein